MSLSPAAWCSREHFFPFHERCYLLRQSVAAYHQYSLQHDTSNLIMACCRLLCDGALFSGVESVPVYLLTVAFDVRRHNYAQFDTLLQVSFLGQK